MSTDQQLVLEASKQTYVRLAEAVGRAAAAALGGAGLGGTQTGAALRSGRMLESASLNLCDPATCILHFKVC